MEEIITITCKRGEAVKAKRLCILWTAMLIILCLLTLVLTLVETIIADTWFGVLLVLFLGVTAYQFIRSYSWWKKQLKSN
jgi:hypothetical protein